MFAYKGMDKANGGSFPNTDEKRYELTQAFPWFGKRTLRRELAQKDAEAMRYDYETMAWDVTTDVKETYYEFCSTRQILAIVEEDIGVLERLKKAMEAVYTTGGANQQDILEVQSEITALQSRLLELGAQLATLNAKLNLLLGYAIDLPLEVMPPTTLPQADERTETWAELAMANRPEIAAREANLARARAERQLMAREYYPDYWLGAEYRMFRADQPNMVMFMVGIDLPLWRPKYRAGVHEAERMIIANEAALTATKIQVAFDVQQSYLNLKSARQILNLYRDTLIPQAKARFASSEASYRTGLTSFLDLLESQRFLLNAQIMMSMAEANVGVQSARLERALGKGIGK